LRAETEADGLPGLARLSIREDRFDIDVYQGSTAALRHDCPSGSHAGTITAMMNATGIAKFEHFFRVAAGLDIDKADLKRYGDFVNRKIQDLLLRGQAAAKANGRDIVEPWDLPITKGLQESIHAFRTVDIASDLKPFLANLVAHPPMDLELSEECEGLLPEIAGGLSVALARVFKIIDPVLKNPSREHWERSFRIFNLLL
jgi:hypothetical protein